ncbi:MAG: riboflavin synthase [Acidimicrobiia bacterium]
MFTGIVEEVGRVEAIEETGAGLRIRIAAQDVTDDLAVGGSVAVNGVCLSAVGVEPGSFEVEAVAETLARSNLVGLAVEAGVNLERPVRAGERLDGHIVQGHVDGVGIVRSVEQEGEARRVWVEAPPGLLRYLVEKGSVAMDGVSLTVSAVNDAGFETVLIPHTLEVTVLGSRRPGDRVNLEVDVLAKYVERLAEASR